MILAMIIGSIKGVQIQLEAQVIYFIEEFYQEIKQMQALIYSVILS